MSLRVVITGPGTGIGKTVFAAGLANLIGANYWKPIQAGREGENDSQIVARLGNLSPDRTVPELYRLQTPASPHCTVEIDEVGIEIDSLNVPDVGNRPLVIEDAGGLMAPVGNGKLYVNIIEQWRLPVILCMSTDPNTISHSLLSIEALRRRQISILGVAFIGESNAVTENAICEIGRVPWLGRLPWLSPLTSKTLQAAFKAAFPVQRFQAAIKRRPSPIWNPLTRHALENRVTKVVRGDGAYLHTADGRRIIDAISSQWVVTHGHCHRPIVRAIQEQAGKLDEVIFAGYTHDDAEEVATRLLRLAPRGLDYLYFSDTGSASVEVALNMALGYWYHANKQRTRIMVMQHSHHAELLRAMSEGGGSASSSAHVRLPFDFSSIPFPAKGRERETLSALACACQNERPAAFLVEPLVLGAAGMLMYPPWVLREMKRICEVSDVLFVADETMTGWGRTGTLFACEQAAVTPDIVCYSKGITGGMLPLAVTLCRADIFDAHCSTARTHTLSRSSSYAANAIACAAAKANLELWQHQETRGRMMSVALMQERAIEPFRVDGRFENVRRTGTITALDLKEMGANHIAEVGPKLQSFFQDRNLLLRPLGKTIYVMPPYCVTMADLEEIYQGICEAADARA